MKKTALALLLVLTTLLCACGFSKYDLKVARGEGYNSGYDEGKKAGYDEGYNEGYSEGYKEGYDDGYNEGYSALKPVAMPQNGAILSGQETKWRSELTIKANGGSSHVVSVKTVDGKECVTFFVRAGCIVTIGVPSQKLCVYFASGKTWYGYGKGLMFGEDTSYTKDDEPLDFAKYTWEYTLSPVYNGNFSETPSDEDEFF
jgi:hypothetical protein